LTNKLDRINKNNHHVFIYFLLLLNSSIKIIGFYSSTVELYARNVIFGVSLTAQKIFFASLGIMLVFFKNLKSSFVVATSQFVLSVRIELALY
jgi:hypothetical protein